MKIDPNQVYPHSPWHAATCLLVVLSLIVGVGMRQPQKDLSAISQPSQRTYDAPFDPAHQRLLVAESDDLRISLKSSSMRNFRKMLSKWREFSFLKKSPAWCG